MAQTTKAKWLRSKNLPEMLSWVSVTHTSSRKLQLFVCACCRSIYDILRVMVLREAIDNAEKYADGQISEDDFRDFVIANSQFANVEFLARQSHNEAVRNLMSEVASYDGFSQAKTIRCIGNILKLRKTESKAHPGLIREIFSNPFPPYSTINPDWLIWNGSVVVSLALAAYDQRLLPSGQLDPARLAILADALEEAGCTDARILGHLRSAGPHVRGCWVLDLILGKS